jgi:hypothetical protein
MENPILSQTIQTLTSRSSSLETTHQEGGSIVLPSKIDKLTLEIMSNKKKYNKILSKTDPQEFQKRQDKKNKIQLFSPRILSLTETLLDSPDTQITNDIHEIFDTYVEACIRYFEMKDYEKKYSYEGREEDDDVLFGKMDDNNEIREPEPSYESFWGKSIKKLQR